MKLRYIYEFLIFVSLILIQVLLLNHINLFGVATPILYIYFFLKLPIGRNLYFVIISGFMLGLIIDVFLNTPGMNAAATTIVATLRKPILDSIYANIEYDEFIPGVYNQDGRFIKFAIAVVGLHLVVLFFIESFTFFNLSSVLLRIITSVGLTLVLVFSLDSLIHNKRNSEQS